MSSKIRAAIPTPRPVNPAANQYQASPAAQTIPAKIIRYTRALPASPEMAKIHTTINPMWAAGHTRDPSPRIPRLSRNQAICLARSTVKVSFTISAGWMLVRPGMAIQDLLPVPSSSPKTISRAMNPRLKARNSHHFSAYCSTSTLEAMK